ncbi:hypothetical protein [Rhodanobacter lindaniclasticus]
MPKRALLRQSLRTALVGGPQWQVVAGGRGRHERERRSSSASRVDFLDIRVPGLTGLEVATAAAEHARRRRGVEFTAYDQYAVDAFSAGAIDYLQADSSRTVARDGGACATCAAAGRPTRPRWPTASGRRQPVGAGTPAPTRRATASAGRAARLILLATSR